MAKKGYSFGALVDKVEADKVEVDGKIAKNVVDIAGKAPTSHTHTPNQVGLENVPNIVHTTNATKDTVVVRDNSGDVNARLIRSDYQDEATISGGLVFRKSTTDNYHRVCTNTENIRAWLGVKDGNTTYNILQDLAPSDNLNNVIATGKYHNPASANATSANNYPEALAGKLEVFASGAMVYQEYLTYNTNVLYTRCRYDSTWFSWKQAVNTDLTATTNRAGIVRLSNSLTSTSQTEAASAEAVRLAHHAAYKDMSSSVDGSTVNLNTILKTGWYGFHSNYQATKDKGFPEDGCAGVLEVVAMDGTDFVSQTYRSHRSSGFWTRSAYDNRSLANTGWTRGGWSGVYINGGANYEHFGQAASIRRVDTGMWVITTAEDFSLYSAQASGGSNGTSHGILYSKRTSKRTIEIICGSEAAVGNRVVPEQIHVNWI